MPVSRKNRNMRKSSRSRKISKSKNSRRSKRNRRTMRRMRGGDDDEQEFTLYNKNFPKDSDGISFTGMYYGIDEENYNENNFYHVVSFMPAFEKNTRVYKLSPKFFDIKLVDAINNSFDLPTNNKEIEQYLQKKVNIKIKPDVIKLRTGTGNPGKDDDYVKFVTKDGFTVEIPRLFIDKKYNKMFKIDKPSNNNNNL